MDVDEKLISVVKQHECLYNASSRNYSDRISKQNAWDEISNEMGIPIQECIIKWRRLRDNFRKALKTREKSEPTSGATRRLIKYEWEFEFLKPYIKYYDHMNNTSSMVSNENTPAVESTTECSLKQETLDIDFDEFTAADTAQESSIPQSRNLSRDVTPTFAEILQNYMEAKSKKERDPIDTFFLAMAASVKRLPEKLQLQVKQKVFNAVNDAELQVLNEGT